MRKTNRKLQRLLPEYTYHIYNKGINSQKVFFNDENYYFFLKRYAHYTKDYLDTYAYCLLPNHFHFLVTVKSSKAIITSAKLNYKSVPKPLIKELLIMLPDLKLPDFQNLAVLYEKVRDPTIQAVITSWIVSNQIRTFFISYSKAINKQEERAGNLFHKPFKRKLVDDKGYMDWLVWYLHRNPLHHKIATDFKNYPYSSYKGILSDKPTLLKRQLVLAAFGGREEMEQFHEQAAVNWENLDKYTLE